MREVLRLTGPAVLTGLLQTAVFLADRLMLARFSQPALASMQVQGPLMWSVFSVFMGLTVGSVALVARAVGAGEQHRARATARSTLRLAATLGIVVVALGQLLTPFVVELVGPNDSVVRGLAVDYLRIGIVGLPGLFLSFSAQMIMSASGDTRTPMFIGAASNAVNVSLNFVFIFGAPSLAVPALGVSGAALASTIAFTLQAALALKVLGSEARSAGTGGWWRPSRDRRTERRALVELVRLSLPALVERIIFHAGFIAYAAIISRLGSLVMASNQALITIESVCFLSGEGFGIAAATVVGQALGRRNPSAASRGGWIATGLGITALSTLGVVVWLTGSWMLPLFVPDDQDGTALVAEATSALWLLAVSQPFMATGIVLGQALRGSGDTRSPVLVTVVGAILIRLPLAWYLGIELGWGLASVWWASLIDWVARTALLVGLWARGRWQHAI